MQRTLNNKALSVATGVDPATLSRYAKRPGFPCDVDPAGNRLANADEVREWILKSIPRAGQRRAVKTVAAPIHAPMESKPLTQHEAGLIEVLRDPQASAVQKTEASHALSCLVVADEYVARSLGGRALEDVKKQSEELRKARDAEIDLATRRGELIDRVVGQAVAGQMANRLNSCLDKIINGLAVQVDQWLIDPALAAADTELRQRTVRAWVEAQCREVRTLEAREVERMIEEERNAEVSA